MKKIIFNLFAIVFLGMAILGSFLPVLPTVPFLLLSVICAAQGSEKLHDQICASQFYQKHLVDYVNDRSMSKESKIKILFVASLMLALAFYFSKVWWARLFIFLVWISKMIYFKYFIKTKKKEVVVCD